MDVYFSNSALETWTYSGTMQRQSLLLIFLHDTKICFLCTYCYRFKFAVYCRYITQVQLVSEKTDY